VAPIQRQRRRGLYSSRLQQFRRMMGLPGRGMQMFDGIFSHQDTIHERDRQTLTDSKDHDRTQLRTVKIIGPIY